MRTRSVVLLCLAAILLMPAGIAWADGWPCDEPPPPNKDGSSGDGARDAREGGESWDDALLVTAVPFSDAGATCDNAGDITPTCGGSDAPDVVYRFIPPVTATFSITLCGSEYDTVLEIFDQDHSSIVCNDDLCGLQSGFWGVALAAGQNYYIVVDGFQTNCGSYVLQIEEAPPCDLVCPPGALVEGEPPCHDDEYGGGYNGGCCGGGGFQPICPQAGNSAVMCAEGGTYVYQGLSYRDSDWFEVWGNDGVVTASVVASFPVQLIFIYGTDCNGLIYDFATGAPCETVVLTHEVAAGVRAWIWVGATVFSGVPCGSDYILTMENIGVGGECPPVPVEQASWGTIKNRYRR